MAEPHKRSKTTEDAEGTIVHRSGTSTWHLILDTGDSGMHLAIISENDLSPKEKAACVFPRVCRQTDRRRMICTNGQDLKNLGIEYKEQLSQLVAKLEWLLFPLDRTSDAPTAPTAWRCLELPTCDVIQKVDEVITYTGSYILE
jgi:hypothetical protein